MNMQTPSGNPSDPQELASFEGWLTRSLYRFDCPDAHTIGEYELDLLAPADRTEVASHLTDCADCHAELTTLREFLRAPTSVPESFTQRARRRLATLFVPSTELAYGGLRGTRDSSAQIYQVDDVTITIAPGDESGALIGLVVSESIPSEQLQGCDVRFVPATGPSTKVELDDLGNFEVQGLSAVYAVELHLPDATIVVEELRVG